jgi:hypothetical protein
MPDDFMDQVAAFRKETGLELSYIGQKSVGNARLFARRARRAELDRITEQRVLEFIKKYRRSAVARHLVADGEDAV